MTDELASVAAERLAELVGRYTPGLLVGLHLVGSSAGSEFRPGRSDLDFVAVLARPPDDAELEALAIIHRSYASDLTLPPLDGIWITEAELAGGPDLTPDGPTSHDNRFAFIGRGNRNPVTWAELRGATSVVGTLDGVALWWEPERLRGWVKQNVDDYWGPWLARARRPLAMLRGAAVMWGILGLCRMLYTLRTGEVTGKAGAGAWALGMLGPEWREIIEEALLIRRTGRGRMNPLRRKREALRFMAMLVELIGRE